MAEGTRLQVSLTQVVAGALATTSAAVAASFIGVYGTIIGAAVMSVVSTVGATVYEHSIHRSKAKLRDVRDGTRLTRVPGGVVARMRRGISAMTPSGAWGRLRAQLAKPAWWKAVGAVSALVFAIAIATITIVELAANKPMYALTTGGETTSGGTSISQSLAGRSGGSGGDGGSGNWDGGQQPAEQQPGSGEDGTGGDGSQGGAPDEVTPTENEGTSRDGDDTDSAERESEPLAPEEGGGDPDSGSSAEPPDEQRDEGAGEDSEEQPDEQQDEQQDEQPSGAP